MIKDVTFWYERKLFVSMHTCLSILFLCVLSNTQTFIRNHSHNKYSMLMWENVLLINFVFHSVLEFDWYENNAYNVGENYLLIFIVHLIWGPENLFYW